MVAPRQAQQPYSNLATENLKFLEGLDESR
jgi:hypothetical protein